MGKLEITYTVWGFDEVGETTFEMDVSENTYERLQRAEDDYEMLDQDFISSEMYSLHKKILRKIRKNMEEESWLDPDDGMIEKRTSWGHSYKEYNDSLSHDSMRFASDYEIEYTIELL